MTNSIEIRDAVIARIETAKVSADPFKARSGQLFKTTSDKAQWLARGERALGVVGGRNNMVIASPAGAREAGSVDRVLVYGPSGVLAHEEPLTVEWTAWFDAQFARKA